MIFTRVLTLVAVVALMVSTAHAQETSSETAAKCSKCPTTTTAAQEGTECSGCPVMAEAMAKLPQMTFRVGDKDLCCGESAMAMAKKKEMPVHFVVAGKAFDDKTHAYTALVEETETFVNDFITPGKCETSGTTTVAGKSCACPVTSAENAKLVKAAVDKVHMTYKVGDKSCHCPMEAATLAAKTEAKTEYVVGEQTTNCEMTARLTLANRRELAFVRID